jgi:hypothetical protein
VSAHETVALCFPQFSVLAKSFKGYDSEST